MQSGLFSQTYNTYTTTITTPMLIIFTILTITSQLVPPSGGLLSPREI